MSRLSSETSPYLLQHADNPVDWYPWGDEARAEARRRDVPLFVSIGYSACHWCHVMAHESFEDMATASYLNEHFVSVKVDREERPDVDALYMEAVQSLSGGGGWPLTVFATAEGRPFFGGTYFPDAARHGMPAFRAVLEAVSDAWTTRRGELVAQADELTDAVAARLAPPPAATRPEAGPLLDGALERFAEVYDAEHPGMGRAPKFPQAPTLELLLRAHAAGRPAAFAMADAILGAMARGGIYDHLGGGFARYATDRAWQLPHFEKMLYDQALLARTYLHAWQVSGDAEMRQVLDETLGYVLRDLRDPSGGLRSAEDADSDGEEGRFYTWTPDELHEVLGEDAEVAALWYGVSATSGVLEGRSILHRPAGAPLLRPGHVEALRSRLHDARSRRARPGIDDKVLTEWNAMACATLAEAAAATGEASWRTAALEIGETLYSAPRRTDGRWMRSWKDGRASHLAVAADYAWLVECFTRLAEATGQARWTERAVEAADGLMALFSADDGSWYSTGVDAESLVVRPRDTYDGATPGAGSVATMALARLGALTGDSRLSTRAEQGLAAAGAALVASPLAFPHLVSAALLIDRGTVEIVVGAASDPQLVTAVQARYLPDTVLAWGEPTRSPLWTGRDGPGDSRGYVCSGGTCLAPVGTVDALLAAISTSSRERS